MFKNLISFLAFLLFARACLCEIIDLGGDDWQFSNHENTFRGQASVPGNIFQDLRNSKMLNANPFYEYSDTINSWVSNQTWIFSKTFNVSTNNVKLVMKSLDTAGYLQINDQLVTFFENMFVKQEVNIRKFVRTDQENKIKILFYSPVEYVNERAKRFKEANGFDLAPNGPPASYHGVAHGNFMRKMQAAFSWDWGAQMVTSGIVDQIYLVTEPPAFEIESAIVETTQVNSSRADGSRDWLIRSKVYLRLNENTNTVSRFRFFLNGEEVKSKNRTTIRVAGGDGAMTLNEFEFGPLQGDKVLPWFPNKFDYLQENRQALKPNLHNFTVRVETRDGSALIHSRSFRIGFRDIKLREDPMANGNAFYFEINGLPFFAKGINYIPTTLNVGNLTEQRKKFTYLLNEVKDAGMNMIRVWGGGMYPLDEFFDLADELGILIWQDFMYACALYESDPKHLEMAKQEVNYQVRRLQHHPSIAIFAANNEIEGAISSKWWGELKDPKVEKRAKEDYIRLFEETIRKAVRELTTAIPFVGSSPTNDDNNTFVQTGSPLKGDIHHYDYGKDPLREKYPRARFVSEFGFQAYPSIATLAKSLERHHLVWPITPELEHRQHAPDQNAKLLAQVLENFDFRGLNSTGQEALEEFIYLTQVIQAVGIKVEAEAYMRDRDFRLWKDDEFSLRAGVKNVNMGSLIWQLNDVWEAPTWSSIDYYGNYKLLHYYIRKFYNPVHVTTDIEGHPGNQTLVVTLINDSLAKIKKIKVYVIIYRSENGYLEPVPAVTFTQEWSLDKLTVLKHRLTDFKERLQKAGCNPIGTCFVRIDYTYLNVYLENFYLLGRPKDLALKPVEIKRRIIKLPDQTAKFVVIVSSEKVALFVQLDWKLGSKIEGRFIDNGFNILKSEYYILFEAEKEYDLDYLTENLQVRSINSY